MRWREKVSEQFALTPIMANILLAFDVERFIHLQKWLTLKTWKELAARMKKIQPLVEARKADETVEAKAYGRDLRQLLYTGRPMTEKDLERYIDQEGKRPEKETRIALP